MSEAFCRNTATSYNFFPIKPELLSGTACGSGHVLLTKPTGLQLFGSRSIQSWADLVTQTRTHTQPKLQRHGKYQLICLYCYLMKQMKKHLHDMRTKRANHPTCTPHSNGWELRVGAVGSNHNVVHHSDQSHRYIWCWNSLKFPRRTICSDTCELTNRSNSRWELAHARSFTSPTRRRETYATILVDVQAVRFLKETIYQSKLDWLQDSIVLI